MDVGKGRELGAEALRFAHRGRVTLCLQPQRVTRLILPGAKLNSCFIAGPKGKTQDVFCKRPPNLFALRVPESSTIANEPP